MMNSFVFLILQLKKIYVLHLPNILRNSIRISDFLNDPPKTIVLIEIA